MQSRRFFDIYILLFNFHFTAGDILRIIVSAYAGFCFGVKRAVKIAEEAAGKQRVFSHGPLIHNLQETERLERMGIRRDTDKEEMQKGDAVLIRTHGVGPEVYLDMEKSGYKILDATCPFVQKAQKLAAEAVQAGYAVIILGDSNHAEILGIKSWTNNLGLVVKSKEDLFECDLPEKIAVLAQTTEKEEKFKELVDYLKNRVQDLKVYNTICSATGLRQDAVRDLAQKVDVMLIIGGKHSSNTTKLWEISKSQDVPSYLIENAVELEPKWFQGVNTVGISAGASTPAWIIEEVINKMEELKTQQPMENEENPVEAVQDNEEEINFQDQLDFHNYQGGEIVKGVVVKITGDEVLVDIRGKSEGIIPANELAYRKVDPRDLVSIGQEILVEVVKEDKEGNIILSRKRALVDEAMEKLESAKENGELITAKVVEAVKGGLLVDVGIRGFVPASQVDVGYVEDLNQYLQKEFILKVIDLDKKNKRAVLSRKAVLEVELKKKREAFWAEVEEGQTRKGIVKRLAAFGAFVDIGGVDGLLHVSEMSWGHVGQPSSVVKEGDEIEVSIIKVDREKEKISLSLKKLLKSPWELAGEKYYSGMILEAKVVRTVPFGAFIELEPGIEGLAHISQLSAKRVNKVEEVVKAGDLVQVKILEFDQEKKRISLSLKDVQADIEKSEFEVYLEKQPESEPVTIGEAVETEKANIEE